MALAEPSVEAAITKSASADKDVVSLSSGDDEVATEAAARPGGRFVQVGDKHDFDNHHLTRYCVLVCSDKA